MAPRLAPPKAGYETRGVLAGRYRGKSLREERVAHTHLYNPDDVRVTDVEFPALCNKKIGLADYYSFSDEERVSCPICPACAKRYNRSVGRDPGEDGMKLDSRFTIAPEYTGHVSGKPQYVARFMGERIASSSTRAGASKLAKTWEVARQSSWRDPAYSETSPAKKRKPATKKRPGSRRDPRPLVPPKARRQSRRTAGCSCSHPKPTKRAVARKPRKTPKRDAQRTCPIGTEVQTLVLSQQMFTERQATGWIKRHGFRLTKIDITPNNYRFRQHPPTNFRAGSFRTIRLRPGVEAVIGCPQ